MSRRNQQQPWRNQERHYCKICNVWMGSDRQSIALHENGKKHQENVERNLQQKRQARSQQEKDAQALQESLKAIEAAALQSYSTHDTGMFVPAPPHPSYHHQQQQHHLFPAGGVAAMAPVTTQQSQTLSTHPSKRQEKNDWQSKRQQRQEEKRHKRDTTTAGDSDNDDEAQLRNQKRRRIAPDEGHYSYQDTTYLEGVVFGDMLEEDMPLEIWTGNLLASTAEKKLPHQHVHWKRGIVAAVRPRRPTSTIPVVDHEDRFVVDIAYLQEPTDTEETLDKSVPLNRIRIVLGSDEDMIPNTLEEARIMAMGGEEEIVMEQKQQPSHPNNNDNDEQDDELDEATGLTGWSTVSVKKTTIHQELKEERERLRQQRRQEAEAAEKVKRQADARKMEEAKVANADDSALGAYDVWSRSKEGYKGIDIHGEAQIQVHELGKKLSDGKASVGFKKTSFKAKKKKQNRRTTSADDD